MAKNQPVSLYADEMTKFNFAFLTYIFIIVIVTRIARKSRGVPLQTSCRRFFDYVALTAPVIMKYSRIIKTVLNAFAMGRC